MAQTKSDNVQINISIPTGWKTELENLARIYSVEEGKTITLDTKWYDTVSNIYNVKHYDIVPHSLPFSPYWYFSWIPLRIKSRKVMVFPSSTELENLARIYSVEEGNTLNN